MLPFISTYLDTWYNFCLFNVEILNQLKYLFLTSLAADYSTELTLEKRFENIDSGVYVTSKQQFFKRLYCSNIENNGNYTFSCLSRSIHSSVNDSRLKVWCIELARMQISRQEKRESSVVALWFFGSDSKSWNLGRGGDTIEHSRAQEERVHARRERRLSSTRYAVYV